MGEAIALAYLQRLRRRQFFTVAALLWAAFWLFLLWPRISFQSDFDLQVRGAQALLAGENPYQTVGPGTNRPFPFPFYYPLPSVFFALPFVWLPLDVIRVLFVLGTTGLLAWIASKEGWKYAPLFASGAFVNAVMIGQWSMVLTASLLLPALAWTAAVKPNVALAFQAARWDRRYLRWLVGPAAVLSILALLWVPTWPLDWLRVVLNAPPGSHSAPILYPGGFLVLLTLLRWRTPEARLLVGLSAVPQTGLLYDMLPLWLVAKTQAQGWLLTAFSWAGLALQTLLTGVYLTSQTIPDTEFIQYFNVYRQEVGKALVLLVYIPALGIVLWNGWRERSLTSATASTPAATLPLDRRRTAGDRPA